MSRKAKVPSRKHVRSHKKGKVAVVMDKSSGSASERGSRESSASGSSSPSPPPYASDSDSRKNSPISPNAPGDAASRRKSGLALIGLSIIFHLICMMIIVTTVAATIGNVMQSVTAFSLGWFTCFFFFISVNSHIMAALALGVALKGGGRRIDASIFMLAIGLVTSVVAFAIFASIITGNATCFRESFCYMGDYVHPTTANPKPPIPVNPGTGKQLDIRARQGAVAVMWMLFAYVAGQAITSTLLYYATTPDRDEDGGADASGKQKQKDITTSSLWMGVSYIILTMLYVAVVLLILGGRSGGTPENPDAERISPKGGELQWWMFVSFTIFCSVLPGALFARSYNLLDGGGGSVGSVSAAIIGVALGIGLFWSVVYGLNLPIVAASPHCCLRLMDLDELPIPSLLNSTATPDEDAITRNIWCGGYRASDAVIRGRNTYCGHVLMYVPGNATHPFAFEHAPHVDFQLAAGCAFMFAVTALLLSAVMEHKIWNKKKK
jgi:hypothetical protein